MENPESVGHDWQWMKSQKKLTGNWVCSKCQASALMFAFKPDDGPLDHTFDEPLVGLTCEEAQVWRIQNQ